ncbi:hypothetical protein [Streptomyces sp. NPDC012616]|uniref:hypothetical protein n=1 Tax=Streptomyces sp. NPDC012616 TaxID=3364840 RepID=UPI0036EC4092
MTTDSAADAVDCTGLAHAFGALPGTPAHPAADVGVLLAAGAPAIASASSLLGRPAR